MSAPPEGLYVVGFICAECESLNRTGPGNRCWNCGTWIVRREDYQVYAHKERETPGFVFVDQH